MPELTIRSLRKELGGSVVLDGVTFSVAEGEFCVLLGPSGCGKTTLLRVVAGLEHHEDGVVFLDGEDLGGRSPRDRDVAMVFQSYALYPHMTAFENMAFPLEARKMPKREIGEKVAQVAGLLGLDGLLDRKPKELSGGQRQRVAIGRALVRKPRLFLFDEPLSNLDAGLRREMRLELASLHGNLGSTVLYVTHDQVEAMTLADKVVLLHQGKVQQVGSPTEIYARPSNLFVAGFIGSPPMNLLHGILDVGRGGLVFQNDDIKVDLGEGLLSQVERPCEAVLGIRPEALSPELVDGAGAPVTPGAAATPAVAVMSARVEMVERLGAEVVIHALCGTTRVTARCRAEPQLDRNDEVRLRWYAASSHLFRADSGAAIAFRDDAGAP